MGDFWDWLDKLLGGDDPSNRQNLGGMSGAWSFGLSNYFARAPGPLAPVLTTYFTSGINFDDPSDLAEAMSMLDAAAAQRMIADDQVPGDGDRVRRGELEQAAAHGQMAVDEPIGQANGVIGQVDQAGGAEAEGGRSRPVGFGPDSDPDSGRRLEVLDRWGSPNAPDTGETSAERRLLGSPTGQSTQNPDQSEALRRTRPESALPARPETGAAPTVSASSEAYGGRDPSWTPFYDLGELQVQVRGEPRPGQGDGVPEVVIHGVRPPRPARTLPPRPETSPAPDGGPERGFWNRGGTGLAFGVATGVAGFVIIVSNPVGWVVGLTGALMLASGVAASGSSIVELGTSYAGKTTAEQDAAANRATSAVLGTSSPGGLLGGVAGTVYSGDANGFEQGAFVGGLAEGAASLGAGLGRMGARELRFGWPRNMRWASARTRNQQVFELGDVAARSRYNPLFPASTERIELSHFLQRQPSQMPNSLPGRIQRLVGESWYERIVNRPWNLIPMWGSEHALIDPKRYGLMKDSFKLSYPPLTGTARWARWAPPWLVQSTYGGMRAGVAVGEYILVDDTGSDTDSEGFSPPPD
ncbi:hypothetical protein OHA79_45780 (plasmid) [Streptomyces sp. NBC_00841]|uniref:hypothetical protein n=1 Tax=Streptomyces sp. NBC_00841 TaxID=2975847 RepID=UPI002DD85015|nr:hypothetical protein [Streptomyces sp. NBC_00841]WSA04948.1 hypothetical protein OHA79_45780 [Streptomyces sp. NBC_00841]